MVEKEKNRVEILRLDA